MRLSFPNNQEMLMHFIYWSIVDFFVNIANESSPETTSVIAGDERILKKVDDGDGSIFSRSKFVITINKETVADKPEPMWMIIFTNDFNVSILFMGFESRPEIHIIKADIGIELNATRPNIVKMEADAREYEGYMYIYNHIVEFIRSIHEGLSKGSTTYDD